MPTLPAPSNSPTNPETKTAPPAPPTPFSSSRVPRNQESTIAAILFIISLLLLCGLIGVFIVKSTKTYKLNAPQLTSLPTTTNKNTVLIEGTAPKQSVIEISSENTSYFADSDADGNFSLNVETRNDGKVTYYAIARKKVLFIKFESDRSNEVSTTVDKTSPNLKLVSLPKLVTSSNYTVKGSTSEPTKVTITLNKTEYTVDTDAKNAFSYPIKFQKGNNTVKITAKDLAGNETSTSSISTSYATGSVYVQGKPGTKQLPNSSGELSSALSTAFGRIIALGAVGIGVLGFIASAGFVSLVKISREES